MPEVVIMMAVLAFLSVALLVAWRLEVAEKRYWKRECERYREMLGLEQKDDEGGGPW